MTDDQKPDPAREPFEFYESTWWKDMSHKLCIDGWPQVVVSLNCFVRDAKAAYLEKCEEISNLTYRRDTLREELFRETDALKAERAKSAELEEKLKEFNEYYTFQQLEKLELENARLKRSIEQMKMPEVAKILERQLEAARQEIAGTQFAFTELAAENAELEADIKRYNEMYDRHVAVREERDKAQARIKELEAALERIIAHSHSWVITEATGRIEKPIHDGYREIARKALEPERKGE